MSTITQEELVTENLSSDWRQGVDGESGYVSADYVIDAYKAGVAAGGKEDFLNSLKGSIGKGVRRAAKVGETFYIQLKEVFNVDCKRVMLKMDSIIDDGQKTCSHFELLFIVAEEDYIKDSFLYIYNVANALCLSVNDDCFNISISFMTEDENIDEGLLMCDGFKYTYEK